MAPLICLLLRTRVPFVPDEALAFDLPDFVLRLGSGGGDPPGRRPVWVARLLSPTWRTPLRHVHARECAQFPVRVWGQANLRNPRHLPRLSGEFSVFDVDSRCPGCHARPTSCPSKPGLLPNLRKHPNPSQSDSHPRWPRPSCIKPELDFHSHFCAPITWDMRFTSP